MMTINCGLDKNNSITHFLQLSHNSEGELFFRVLWKDLKPSYYFDGEDNSGINISNIDHISFHKDGTVHSRYYTAEGKKPRKKIEQKLPGAFDKMPSDCYLPIFTFSIYDIDHFRQYFGQISPLVLGDTQNITYNWDANDFNKFSLVFFILGHDVDSNAMLGKYNDLFNIHVSPLILNFGGPDSNIKIKGDKMAQIGGYNLLIAYTKKVIKRPINNPLIKGYTQNPPGNVSNPSIPKEALMGISLVSSYTKLMNLE